MITIRCVEDTDMYDDYAEAVKEIRKVIKDKYICALECYMTGDPIPIAIHIWKEGELR